MEHTLRRASVQAGLLANVNLELDEDTDFEYFEAPEGEDLPAYRERQAWVAERLNELRTVFQPRSTEAVTLRALWMQGGVAHVFFQDADLVDGPAGQRLKHR